MKPTASMCRRCIRRRSATAATIATSRNAPPASAASVASLAKRRKSGSFMARAIWAADRRPAIPPRAARARTRDPSGEAMDAGPAHRPLLALLIRLGAIAALSTMSALIKLASQRGIHLLEIMFWRQFLTIPILLAWILPTSGIGALATTRPGTHFLRGLYGTIGMLLNFGAVILLPLAEATTINFTVPIWAVLLSIVLLKEKVGLWRWSAVLLGFAGVLVIAQPGDGHFPLYGALVALGGAFMIARSEEHTSELQSLAYLV